MTAIDIALFPGYFRAYSWANVNHKARGYPGDSFPEFPWVKSLEERGAWLSQQVEIDSAPTDYLREILAWGAGKNDPRMRFEAGLGNVSLLALFQPVVDNLNDPAKAIEAALQIPRCGLTYASKLLRFLKPSIHASLDSRKAWKQAQGLSWDDWAAAYYRNHLGALIAALNARHCGRPFSEILYEWVHQ